MFEPCHVVECRQVFWRNMIASTLENTSWKSPGNTIAETLNFKISLDSSTLKNLCLWCEFQSHLLFIISLLLENFLTALAGPLKLSMGRPKLDMSDLIDSNNILRCVYNYWIKLSLWSEELWRSRRASADDSFSKSPKFVRSKKCKSCVQWLFYYSFKILSSLHNGSKTS